MFGMKPKGLFGNRQPWETPPIIPQQQGPQPEEMRGGLGQVIPQQQPEKRGLFGKLLGKGWEDKAFALGGIMQGDPRAAQHLMDTRNMGAQLEAQRAEDMRKRSLDFADWQKREQWKIDNPASVNNDTVADYQFIRQTLGGDAAEEFLRNKANPPQYRQGPDGQFYRIDTAPAPTAPVGKLTPITGGTGGNVGGTFPPR